MQAGSLPLTNPARRRRATDPRTSVEAARVAAKASIEAMRAVECIMRDCRPRIDEEIWVDCRSAGYLKAPETIRHGRLALSESGILRETGVTRKTPRGLPSREWVLSSTFPLRLFTNGLDFVIAPDTSTATSLRAGYYVKYPDFVPAGHGGSEWVAVKDSEPFIALELQSGRPVERTQPVIAWINEKGVGYFAGMVSR